MLANDERAAAYRRWQVAILAWNAAWAAWSTSSAHPQRRGRLFEARLLAHQEMQAAYEAYAALSDEG